MSKSVLALATQRGVQTPQAPERYERSEATIPYRLTRRFEALASSLDLNDRSVRERLVARLSSARTESFAWLCLALLERGQARAWEGPARLAACDILAQASATHLRFAAYRWLAGLYTIDLRCEMRARKVLHSAMQREQGMAARRVKQLLRTC